MANLVPGHVLNNRFLLIEQLGQGSFGMAFHSFDLELKQNVVVKVLQSANPTEEEVLCFKAEAKNLSLVESPYVVGCLGYFDSEGANAAPVIVTEFRWGRPLFRISQGEGRIGETSGYLRLQVLVNILAQVSEGLKAIHKAGVIHRDLKGDNVVVDENWHADIIDFGMSGSKFDLSDRRSGAVRFYAPESEVSGCSELTDIYALGVLMFQVLGGEFPIHRLPVDLKFLIPHRFYNENDIEITAEVAGKLNDIFLKACAEKPSDRFQSAAEFANELWSVSNYFFTKRNFGSKPLAKPWFQGELSLKEFARHVMLLTNENIQSNEYLRLDGYFINQTERMSTSGNRSPAFIFELKGCKYQINLDSSRLSLYRLAKDIRKAAASKNSIESVFSPTILSGGDRCLRLSSNFPKLDGSIPANGFYCYAVEDMQKKPSFEE
jgi:serine/threonine protein kinase